MKSISFSFRSSRLVVLSIALLSTAVRIDAQQGVATPGQETHGGDVFDTTPGNADGIKFWDFVEYGDSFHPFEVEGAGPILRSRFDGLVKKAPQTMWALRNLANQSVWSFVEPQLKDQPPTGDSNLILSYQRIQAALSVPSKLSVQINKSIWKQLTPTAQAFLLMHELLWLAEKSPVLYLGINPNLIIIPKIDDEAQKSNFISVPQLVHSASEKTPLVLSEISTTSSDIRRITGYLMNPSITDGPDVTGIDILNFLKTAVGRVHIERPLSFEFSLPTIKKTEFITTGAGGAEVKFPSYVFEDVVESRLYRGWVTSTASKDKVNAQSSRDTNELRAPSKDGRNQINAQLTDEYSDFVHAERLYHIIRKYRLTYASFSELTALGTLAERELPIVTEAVAEQRGQALRKRKQEELNAAYQQRKQELLKCNENLPTTLNRFIGDFQILNGSSVVSIGTGSVVFREWDPQKEVMKLYVIPSKFKGTDLVARPYVVTIRPDLSCIYQVQSETFIERLRDSKGDKLNGADKMSVLQTDTAHLDGKLNFALHLLEPQNQSIIKTKTYSIPLNLTEIK